jgi:toxin ParE1/3/4
MRRPYSLRYFKTAERDLLNILEYIKRDKPQAAHDFINKTDAKISLLMNNPKLGIIPKDERLQKLGYRILIIDNYLVFYNIRGKTIQIRRVLHGARRYQFLL